MADLIERKLAAGLAESVGDPRKAVLDHEVTAAMFGRVNRGVGGFDQITWPRAVVGADRSEPDRDRDVMIAGGPMRHRQVLYRGAHHLGDLARPCGAGIRLQQTKFLSAI